LDPLPLPAGVRSRFVEGINGLRLHVLEAGDPKAPGLLLLHGFPELAFSWRKVMLPLAEAGYHVMAPDQRGYGRTTGWDPDYDGDLASFHLLNLARDALGLVKALGHETVHLAGHDFGSWVAGWCALVRPDVFRAVALMSAPFTGAPGLEPPAPDPIHAALAALPRPRKHYQAYYCTRPANDDMVRCAQGLHAFLRAYFHMKSADWKQNRPVPLRAWTAAEVAQMPTYYIMDLNENMAQTVAHEMPTAAEIAACRWMTEAEMAVYAAEFGRTGLQGGLNWYRARVTPPLGRLPASARSGGHARQGLRRLSGHAPRRGRRPLGAAGAAGGGRAAAARVLRPRRLHVVERHPDQAVDQGGVRGRSLRQAAQEEVRQAVHGCPKHERHTHRFGDAAGAHRLHQDAEGLA